MEEQEEERLKEAKELLREFHEDAIKAGLTVIKSQIMTIEEIASTKITEDSISTTADICSNMINIMGQVSKLQQDLNETG